jgi:hypothetical protein
VNSAIRRFSIWTAALLIGLPGLYLALGAFYFSRIVLLAVWTGVFERPDFREATGGVTIFRVTNPDWFWGNVEFYSFLSVGLWVIAVVLILPFTIRIASGFRRGSSAARARD